MKFGVLKSTTLNFVLCSTMHCSVLYWSLLNCTVVHCTGHMIRTETRDNNTALQLVKVLVTWYRHINNIINYNGELLIYILQFCVYCSLILLEQSTLVCKLKVYYRTVYCTTTIQCIRQATVKYCISYNKQWVYILRWIVLESGRSTHSTAVCRSGSPQYLLKMKND